MEIDIKETGTGLVIRYAGKLVTELTPCGPVTTEDYEADVVRGRVAANLIGMVRSIMADASKAHRRPDHALPTEEKRQAAYLRGMIAGYEGQTAPHPIKGVPPILPESTLTFAHGYEAGETLRRFVKLIETPGTASEMKPGEANGREDA